MFVMPKADCGQAMLRRFDTRRALRAVRRSFYNVGGDGEIQAVSGRSDALDNARIGFSRAECHHYVAALNKPFPLNRIILDRLLQHIVRWSQPPHSAA